MTLSATVPPEDIYIPICFYFNISAKYFIAKISLFTFQYVSILINEAKKYVINLLEFTFQYVSILILIWEMWLGTAYIYIPICFYFNPSPEFPLLFYLISPLSVDQPKFTNILPYLLH